MRAKTIRVDRWEKTPTRTAQDKIKIKKTPAGSRLAGVRLCCTNFTLPTGALDYATSKEILKLIEQVNRKYGNTVVMVTHNNAIEKMADRVVKLHDGRIRENFRNETRMAAEDLEW